MVRQRAYAAPKEAVSHVDDLFAQPQHEQELELELELELRQQEPLTLRPNEYRAAILRPAPCGHPDLLCAPCSSRSDLVRRLNYYLRPDADHEIDFISTMRLCAHIGMKSQ
ncbi:hypothetical protein [Silvimonas amylolytica]|uniref:hypothetical protein n=1 Tax=Silvimonas amylolytica TaxID=449663 RepID=UPI00166E4C75|nr:hypothetical protein [Silvimonas amylolytica]